MDAAGRQVIDFAAACRTLGKVGELADNIMRIAESGAWRQYRTAIGVQTWQECECDYFLIACDLEYDDVYRAIRWNKLGETTLAMLDQDAPAEKRRPIEQATASYHATGPETLSERAERLHWFTKNGKLRPPISGRQRAKQSSGGKTPEQQAMERRERRLSQEQRRELDQTMSELVAQLDDDEIRYLVNRLVKQLQRPRGRPQSDHEQWARDIADLNGDTKALAERWGVSQVRARARRLEIRELSSGGGVYGGSTETRA